jgi:threonine 3-dehydrogenase
MFDTWYKMNVFIESGLDLSPVITHRFGVSEYEEAFTVAGSDESGKVLIIWD